MLGMFFLPKPSQAQDNDFMLWTELKFAHPFKGSPFTLIWATESRFNQNVTRYMVFNTTLGFSAKVTKWFTPYFLIRYEKESGKHWELRLMPQFVVAGKLGPVKFADRNRFEIRTFPGEDVKFRYRNRIKIGPKFKAKKVSISPWISNEIFIQSTGGFNQDRLASGFTFGFDEDRFKWTLYYLLRLDNKDGWIRRHVLGISMAFKY